MISLRGPKFKYFALVMAVIALAFGVYVTFFRSAGFSGIQATIVSIVEEPSVFENDSPEHTVTVEYVVDGTRYTSVLDYYSPSFKVTLSGVDFFGLWTCQACGLLY